MKRIKKEQAIFTMSGKHKPAATIQSGETIVFETSDCFNSQLTSEDQTISEVKGEFINPATGPLYVEGAEIGDILKIEILDIKTNDKGVMTADPGDDLLGAMYKDGKVKIIPIVDDLAYFNEFLKLPVNPMIGVIGVATSEEALSTVMPGSHGGNMDCKEITQGSTLYLPVNVRGGLLAMGDLHAIMGDGETGGCGLEVGGEVTIKVEVVKNKELPTPMLVNNNKLMAIATEKTIEEANRRAVVNMHAFLVNELNLNDQDAGLLLSLVGDLKICQIVDPLMTVRMELPMYILEKYGYSMV